LATSDSIRLPVTIEILTPDKMALANQRDYWKEQALDAIDMWAKAEKVADALANKLAEQALLNEELRARVDWYRNMYHMVGGDKMNDLIAEHRLNLVSGDGDV
jgi:hypothetical protein